MDLKSVLGDVVKANVSADAWAGLADKVKEFQGSYPAFVTAFAAAPRKTGKAQVIVNDDVSKKIDQLRPGFTISSWTIDRLTRVWLISNLSSAPRESYIRAVESLFPTAEMNEQVALYSALPLLEYPEAWRHRCTEGIRSNIGSVLESIMCDNPYPCEQLDELAWNQLVLKAIFTEKPVHRIIGLDKRANKNLANTLSDYAHERWAAHRTVNPLLWRCVSGFVDDRIFHDIAKIASSENELEREAAALVIQHDQFPALKSLLDKNPQLTPLLKTTSWEGIAMKAVAVS